jgi:hypothetical protein
MYIGQAIAEIVKMHEPVPLRLAMNVPDTYKCAKLRKSFGWVLEYAYSQKLCPKSGGALFDLAIVLGCYMAVDH